MFDHVIDLEYVIKGLEEVQARAQSGQLGLRATRLEMQNSVGVGVRHGEIETRIIIELDLRHLQYHHYNDPTSAAPRNEKPLELLFLPEH